jgi:hypothetical protein
MTTAATRQTIPFPALVLGLGGLLPFLFGALLAIFPGLLPALTAPSGTAGDKPLISAIAMLGAYGAVILSFLGGVRWGNLLEDRNRLERWLPLSLSVIPSLIAWPALLLTAPAMFGLLVAGFVFQYLLDINDVAQGQLPAWFGRLRLMLTSGAVICLSVGLVASLS